MPLVNKNLKVGPVKLYHVGILALAYVGWRVWRKR
jgi:hypothetical protein